MKKNKLANRVRVQGNLTAQNSLGEALRLTDYDVWNPSLSSFNGYNNISLELLSLQQMLLTYLYKQYGVLGKIIDVPVNDAYKYGGFDLEAETIEENEIKSLKDVFTQKGDLEKIKTARRWARLYGGGGLICVDGDDLSEPLNYNKLYNRDFRLVAVDRWQLTYNKTNVDIPGGDWILSNYGGSQNSQKVDKTRLCILRGKTAPYLIEQQTQGWGMSVYEQVFQDVNQLFKAKNVLFELLDEAKIDILKLSTIEQALSSGVGERNLQKMVDFIARNKNYKSQITLSTNDDYDQKQLGFGGMAEILKEIRVMLAGSADMPVNKLWGEGVTGFGSGEDSLENYNGMIESEIRTPDNAIIDWVLKLRCFQLFGREVKDLLKVWKPLRVMTSIDEQNINDHKVDNILKLFDRGLLSPQEAMEYFKKQGIYLMNTKALNGDLEDMPLENKE